jgi:hypothetical protein
MQVARVSVTQKTQQLARSRCIFSCLREERTESFLLKVAVAEANDKHHIDPQSKEQALANKTTVV